VHQDGALSVANLLSTVQYTLQYTLQLCTMDCGHILLASDPHLLHHHHTFTKQHIYQLRQDLLKLSAALSHCRHTQSKCALIPC
jgi:hypothetical protein